MFDMELSELNASTNLMDPTQEVSFSGETMQQMVERKTREKIQAEWKRLRPEHPGYVWSPIGHEEKMREVKRKVSVKMALPHVGGSV